MEYGGSGPAAIFPFRTSPRAAGTAEIRKQKRGNPMSEYVVELKNITKRFPGVVALKNMSIGIRPGEIHGLIG